MKNSKNQNVSITGIGLVSALGNSISQFWNGLVSQPAVIKHTDLLSKSENRNAFGIEAEFPVRDSCSESRALEMGKSALKSALKDWGGNLSEYKRICLVVGSGLGLSDCLLYKDDLQYDTEFLPSFGKSLSSFIRADCNEVYIANACCAGAQAVCYGMDLLHLDCYDLVIAGGVDTLSNIAHSGFLRLNAIDFNGCRPFDCDRKGIVTGEGAVFFVLEKLSHSLNKNLKLYCTLEGSGITNDAYHIVQMKNDGKEILRAMEQALYDSGLDRGEIDLVIAHGTGTTQNDRVEAGVIAEFFGEHLNHMQVTSPKGAIGHTGGASGAFGLLTAICSFIYNGVPPISNLRNIDPQFSIPIVKKCMVKGRIVAAMVNTFAFGGSNVILVCKRWAAND